MTKLLKSAVLILLFLFFCPAFILAEDITITTYYPSPYGSYKNLNIYNQDESLTQTDFTQGLTKAGLIITTDYTADAYTPGIFWTMTNSTPTKPKAGIYLKETGTGTNMYLGTSNSYVTGITNDAVVINPSGNVGIGVLAPAQKLDVAGYIKTQHPYFMASSSDASRAGVALWNTIVHNQVMSGNSGGWYNPGNGRFTAPVKGIYLFIAQHYIYAAVSGAPYIHHTIGVNGNITGAGYSSTSGGYTIFQENLWTYDSSTVTVTLLSLNVGDYVNDNAYVSTAAYPYMYGYHSIFQGVLLYAL